VTPPPLLYAPADAARLLGVGRSTVYELLADGKLPSVKIGRARRITRAAIDDFVRALPTA
jgi:excisionase family DNA binding protein